MICLISQVLNFQVLFHVFNTIADRNDNLYTAIKVTSHLRDFPWQRHLVQFPLKPFGPVLDSNMQTPPPTTSL